MKIIDDMDVAVQIAVSAEHIPSSSRYDNITILQTQNEIYNFENTKYFCVIVILL